MKKIEFFKSVDNLNIILILIILVIIVFRVKYYHMTRLIIWIPSVLGLAFVFFFNKYLFSAVAITFTLVSSTILIQLDKNKKFSLYYTFGLLFLALFIAFTIHFGGTVNSVLTMPLFLAIMSISLCVIIISSIIAVLTEKANFLFLLNVIGWVIIGLAWFFQWSGIIIGTILLVVYFILVNKNSSDKVI